MMSINFITFYLFVCMCAYCVCTYICACCMCAFVCAHAISDMKVEVSFGEAALSSTVFSSGPDFSSSGEVGENKPRKEQECS